MTTKQEKKAALVIAVQALLQKKTVGTQEEIKQALQNQGFVVNQVKISRILHKLGAIKINEDNKLVYRLPTELLTISRNDSLKHVILNIAHNDSLIVIQTAPGCAQLIARFLDQGRDIDILGTVAGDDTVFIAPVANKHIKKIYQQIYQLLLD